MGSVKSLFEKFIGHSGDVFYRHPGRADLLSPRLVFFGEQIWPATISCKHLLYSSLSLIANLN